MVRNIVGLGLLMVGFLLGISQGGAQVEIDPALVPKSFLSGKDWRGLSKGEQQAYAVGVVDGLDLAFAYEKARDQPCLDQSLRDRHVLGSSPCHAPGGT